MSKEDKYTLGMIGLGTMGRNLLLNMGKDSRLRVASALSVVRSWGFVVRKRSP